MGAFVYAGAQFGTVISMPLSGLLAEYSWPSIFYVFGAIGTVWCVFFLWTCREDPQSHETIDEDERKYIVQSLWGNAKMTSPPIPWKSMLTSLPFFAILLAQWVYCLLIAAIGNKFTCTAIYLLYSHSMAQNYGYETLMTELPTYMKQVLRFSIREVSFYFIFGRFSGDGIMWWSNLSQTQYFQGMELYEKFLSRMESFPPFPISPCGFSPIFFQSLLIRWSRVEDLHTR